MRAGFVFNFSNPSSSSCCCCQSPAGECIRTEHKWIEPNNCVRLCGTRKDDLSSGIFFGGDFAIIEYQNIERPRDTHPPVQSLSSYNIMLNGSLWNGTHRRNALHSNSRAGTAGRSGKEFHPIDHRKIMLPCPMAESCLSQKFHSALPIPGDRVAAIAFHRGGFPITLCRTYEPSKILTPERA